MIHFGSEEVQREFVSNNDNFCNFSIIYELDWSTLTNKRLVLSCIFLISFEENRLAKQLCLSLKDVFGSQVLKGEQLKNLQPEVLMTLKKLDFSPRSEAEIEIGKMIYYK